MQQDHNSLSRDTLIETYQRYVHSLAGLMISTMGLPQSLLDDLVSAGLLGLIEAAERFDLEHGKNFKGYAFYRIRGAMIDSIRDSSEFSGRAYRAARAFEAYSTLRDEYVHIRNTVERNDRKRRLEEILNIAAEGALAYRMCIPEDDVNVPLELQARKNAEQMLIAEENNKKVSVLVETLPEKERLIIEEYYTNGLSFVQITEKYPTLSKSWVSRLHKRALQQLRIGMLSD